MRPRERWKWSRAAGTLLVSVRCYERMEWRGSVCSPCTLATFSRSRSAYDNVVLSRLILWIKIMIKVGHVVNEFQFTKYKEASTFSAAP